MMRPVQAILLSLGIYLLPTLLTAQSYFQNDYSESGYGFDIRSVTQLKGGQIAIAGQRISEVNQQRKAAVLLVNANGSKLWGLELGNQAAAPTITALEPTPDDKLLAVFASQTGNNQNGIVKIDLSGNLEWTQFFNNIPDYRILRIQNIPGGFILTGSGADGDALIKKTDSNGGEIWSQNIAFPGADLTLHQVWADDQGGIFAAGTIFQNGFFDGFVIKLSSAGTLNWSRRFGTAEHDELLHLAPTEDGHLLAGGYSFGSDNFKKGWLLKLDRQGEVLWSRSYGEPGLDVGINSLEAYPGGAVFSIAEDGPVPTLGAGIGRINNFGDLLWIKSYNQSGAFGINGQMTIAANNDLLLAASLQTGSGKGLLLARTNGNGDTPPCCLKSFNLNVVNLSISNTVFVPNLNSAISLLPLALTSAPFDFNLTSLCEPANLDFSISDSTLCPGECIEVEITNPTLGASYSWAYPGGVQDPNNPNRICFPEIDDDVTISLTANACAFQQKTTVIQPESGKNLYPNAFTPDGDGVNDTFQPILFCPSPVYSLNIFSRWGELVFESVDPNAGWDGTVNGINAPSDVYIWVLETQNELGTFRKQGDVILLR